MPKEFGAAPQFKRNWRTLSLFNIFRIIVAATLYSLSLFNIGNFTSSINHPELYKSISFLFLIFSMFSSLAIHKHWPRFSSQAYLYAILDIIAITTLTHAVSSNDGSLEILIIITIIGTSLLLPERGAIIIASIATLTLLTERGYTQLLDQTSVNYTQAGLLGATFFATALLSAMFNRRLKESELLAEQRGIDLANLAQLNEHVIQLLQFGVLVVDAKQKIRLINQAAQKLLILPKSHCTLQQASNELHHHYELWLTNLQQPNTSLTIAETNAEVNVQFSYLGGTAKYGSVIFLEDSSALAQKAQHLKLASLGQLTASIAHEIRNPLGAISHASQLLEESPDLGKDDHRLIEIIGNHSSRVNTIIESILQLSRREKFNPTQLSINNWLVEHIDELADCNHIERSAITAYTSDIDSIILMDPTHLYQVVNNLCSNAIHYSREVSDPTKVEFHCGQLEATGHPYLEIRDHGPGISPADTSHIFEPFFTTGNSGTGLGLYIARELCECNHARLEYITRDNGACFRITFQQPRE